LIFRKGAKVIFYSLALFLGGCKLSFKRPFQPAETAGEQQKGDQT